MGVQVIYTGYTGLSENDVHDRTTIIILVFIPYSIICLPMAAVARRVGCKSNNIYIIIYNHAADIHFVVKSPVVT